MAADIKEEVQHILTEVGVSPEELRAAVQLLATTARQGVAVVSGGDVSWPRVPPLPTADAVYQLNQRLTSLEQRVRENNEKLDQVLAALSSK